ncbi:thymidine phosphorylase [Kaistia algarum]|uniref:thymidine phosphorylase n=1 Tax=Kaistia algarum TaxID=2083279 RepID=UPI000CE8CE05|nr:thymidine phosphorylase [Kaistia algarum]MCX5514374.1 thymidine phosphorylase [Kaistia algarum]PPE79122.1 thymidine phosphorylase [Kaistia algarum]
MTRFFPQEVIRKKRDRGTLSPEEIAFFVKGITDGSISEGQIGAFNMAVYLNGMERDETTAFALAMRDSGDVIDWNSIGLSGPTIIDKHSSGGVGDEKVSLILAPLVAACGIHMPMISARGLGHTGGEVDLMESMGCHIGPPSEVFMKTVADVGCAIIGPTGRLAPADARIYYVRDVTATVESIPLITGSIMSKKLAAGINGLVMSVNFGSGAFMTTIEDARALAQSMLGVAEGAGVPMVTHLGDMDEVMGDAVGSLPQIREVIAFLTGGPREARLEIIVMELAAEVLVMGDLAPDLGTAKSMLAARLADGSAAQRFGRMVAALGGPVDLVGAPDAHLERAPYIRPVFALGEGSVARVDARAVGMALLSIGSGRTRPDQSIDHAVGLTGMIHVGDVAGPERPIAMLHARDEAAWDRAAAGLRAAVTLADAAVPARAVLHDRLATAL